MSATPNAAAAMLRANQQIDVREILGAIHAPTLVLNRRGTRLVDSAAVRYFADQINGAQFHELPGEDVFPYLGDQDSVLAEIEEFVTGTRPPPPTDRYLATIVFTDVVASTELAQQHGDTRWRDTLDATTRSRGVSQADTAAESSTPPATEHSQHSTGQPTASSTPAPSPMQPTNWDCKYAQVYTPARSNTAETTSPASESMSELGWRRSPAPIRFSSPTQFGNSRSAPRQSSSTMVNTNSEASAVRGTSTRSK
jgi:hypothetical protein